MHIKMSQYEIDWATIEANYDTLFGDMDSVLKREYEQLIDMKRRSQTHFMMEVREHLSIPTSFEHDTVASGIFGCEREYYGQGDNECSPMCIRDTCRRSVWNMNSSGNNIRRIHDSEGRYAHVYAPSSVKKPLKTLRSNRSMIRKLKEYGVVNVEVYKMAFSMSEYRGSINLNTGRFEKKKHSSNSENPRGNRSHDDHSADNKSSGNRSHDDHSADNKSSSNRSHDDHSADNKSSGNKPTTVSTTLTSTGRFSDSRSSGSGYNGDMESGYSSYEGEKYEDAVHEQDDSWSYANIIFIVLFIFAFICIILWWRMSDYQFRSFALDDKTLESWLRWRG